MKYALITGGSRGIGRSVSIELAKLAYPVIVNYQTNEIAARETEELIVNAGGKAEILQFDVSKVDEVDAALMAWQEAHPDDYIAVLVNNAGVREDTMMMWMQNKQWEDIIGVHLNGFFYVTRRLLKDMLTKRFGADYQCCITFGAERLARTNKLFGG